MDTEQVVDKILSEAQERAGKIKARANEKARAQEAELKAQLEEFGTETKALAAAAAEDKKARMFAAVRMEIRKELLTAKGALLNEVFDKALQRIKSMPDQEYRDFISSLMQKAVETGDEEIIIGTGEKRFDHEFIKQINHKLGSGLKGNLKLAEKKANIEGGFILRSGNIKVNVSIDVMLADAREKLEIELVHEMFNEDQ